MSSIVDVFVVALLAGSATGLGALPIFLTARVSHRVYDGTLGLVAEIMFGAAVFTLIVPGLELGTLAEEIAGILLGGGTFLLAKRMIPHLHVLFEEEEYHGPEVDSTGEHRRKAALVASAITIHNVPEGLDIEMAFASGLEGIGIAIAIAIQNIPDGFAMAVPASQTGLSKPRTLLYTTLSGGVSEPLAAVTGSFSSASYRLPFRWQRVSQPRR